MGILPGAILFTTTGAGFVVFYRQHPILAVGIAICGVVVLAVTLARYYQIGKLMIAQRRSWFLYRRRIGG